MLERKNLIASPLVDTPGVGGGEMEILECVSRLEIGFKV